MRYLIQVDRPGQNLRIEDVKKMLEKTGLTVDETYAPVLIDRNLGRYVVRGSGTPQSSEKAKQIQGVRIFNDSRIEPF
jgi:hypothetical protein